MSGKRAKQLRKQQRAAGIEPHLDAKRRRVAEAAALIEKQRAEAETFRLEHPEEYARQQRENKEKFQQAMTAITTVLGAIIR